MGIDDDLPNKMVGIYSTKMSMTLLYHSKVIKLEFIQPKGNFPKMTKTEMLLSLAMKFPRESSKE